MSDTRAVQSLPIAGIAIGPRIGFYSADHAQHLSRSMAAEGQHDPIHVKRNGNAAKFPWTLVAGLHRLRGAEAIGWTEIDAIEVARSGASEAELRRLELSENLDHRQRRPIERAIFIAARAALEEAIDHPDHVGERSQDRAVRARRATPVIVTDVADWRQRTADAMGCSISTLERLQRIYRAIVQSLPDLAEELNFHPLGESQSAMLRVATFKYEDTRRKAAEAILARPECQSIDEVLSKAGLASSTGSRVRDLGAKVMSAWSEMTLHQRQAHVDWLAEKMTEGMAEGLVRRLREIGRLP